MAEAQEAVEAEFEPAEETPKGTALARADDRPAGAITPMGMLDRALDRGADIAVLDKLMDLQERWEKNEARKAFDEAMAAARAEIPTIRKNRQVGFDSKKAGSSRTEYRHEDLGQIAQTVDPILAKHGLSYRFRTTADVNQPVTVTCIVSHRLGHSEENTLTGPRDDSGNKNSIQQIGSTITYLQRYTLKAALGLAAANDDDGCTSESPAEPDNAKLAQVRNLIDDANVSEESVCKTMGVEALTDMSDAECDRVITSLNARIAKAQQEAKQAEPAQ